MNTLLSRLRSDQEGVAMVLVLVATVILSVLGVALLELVTNETKRSGASVKSQTSFQAAEAGIDDYLAKLVDNRVYYLQYVHPAESTRRDTPSGTNVGVSGACTTSSKPAPVAWSYGTTWASPNGKDRWCQLPGGFEYNLQITSPQTPGNMTDGIEIMATGRKTGSAGDVRSIEVLVDPTSVADYQMLSASSISYGNDATTTGKLYSAVNICHQGTAWANLYADGSITCTPSLQGGAVTYNSATIPTPPSGTNFAALQVALIDVKRAADTGGINLDTYAAIPSPDEHGWRLTFQSSGNVLAESCRMNGGDLADVTPICGGAGAWTGTLTIPPNGAIYATKTTII
jgi:Tfp pilus assembly protein PilX